MDAFREGAAALGRRIGAGRVDPVELAEAALAAIDVHPAGARIYARTLPERARQEAEAARGRARAGRRLGPLDGVPVSWKDLFDTAGAATEAGSRLLAGRVPERDATAVARGTAAGWVALGKTHMSELAFSGLGLNPRAATPPGAHGDGLAPGGSSSGAAASVAHGLAAAAVGTDTGGSVRLPAAWNDLVGLKPGHGAIPAAGVVPLVERLDTVGPLARTVEDAALMWADLGQVPAPDLGGATLAGTRLAVLETVALDELQDAPAAAFEAALARLTAAGARLERLTVPAVRPAMDLSVTVYAGEGWAIWGERIEARPGAVWPEIETRLRGGEALSARAFVNAWRTLATLRAEWAEAAAPFDAVICPTAPILPPEAAPLIENAETGDGAAYRHANLMSLRNTRIGNLMGLAGISLPTGRPSCGLLLNGPAGDEARLLRLAAATELALQG